MISRWIGQSVLATVFVGVALLGLSYTANTVILWAAGVGSLASSAYIVFGRPSGASSRTVNLLGGYGIAIVVGELLRVVAMHFFSLKMTEFTAFGSHAFFALAVFAMLAFVICFVVMLVFGLEHPPAAGLAVVLVIDLHDYAALVVIMAAVLLLAAMRELLGCWLRDLQ